MQGKALPGFRDFSPDELALRNHIFATWREVARRYGFQEYDGPPLEPLELYTDKSGEEIVQLLHDLLTALVRIQPQRHEPPATLARKGGAPARAPRRPPRRYSGPPPPRAPPQHVGRLRGGLR